jgi:hypothetical protein
MTFSHLPAFLATCFTHLATALDARTALRLPLLLAGMLCAGGRRTCTAWFRAADIGDDFRNACVTRGEGDEGTYSEPNPYSPRILIRIRLLRRPSNSP